MADADAPTSPHTTPEEVLATAKQMLADIYRGGAFLGRWVKNGQAGLRPEAREQSAAGV